MPGKKSEMISPMKFKCRQCVYKTKNRSDLRRHERRHKDVKFPCDICNMPFMTAGHLGGHKRSAHNVQSDRATSKPPSRHFCHECDYTTVYSSDMSKHRRKHEDNKHPCPICNYPFGHITTLTIHIRKYHGKDETMDHEKENYRTENQRKAKEKSNLKDDSSLKQGRGPTYGMSNKRDTRRATSTVTGQSVERNSVETFGRYDSDNETLLAIKVGYSGNKAKSGEIRTGIRTKGAFVSEKTRNVLPQEKIESSSSNDMKTTKTKVYFCNLCEFNTRDVDTFDRHTKRHNKGKFKCDTCGMPFLFKTNLDKHLETKHVDLSETSDSSFDTADMNSPTILRCAQCKFVTYSYNQLESHVAQHSKQAFREDKDCSKMGPQSLNSLDKEVIQSDKNSERINEAVKDNKSDEKLKDIDSVKELEKDGQLKSSDENLMKGTEEYHCQECNYVTSDKKFIKLHMTMHGSDYMAPRNGNTRKRSTSAKALGYEIRLKGTGNKQSMSSSGVEIKQTLYHTNAATCITDSKEQSEKQPIRSRASSDKDETDFFYIEKVADGCNLNVTKVEGFKEVVVEKGSDAGSGDSIIQGSNEAKFKDLVGELTRADFKRTKKFYTTEQVNDQVLYGCKLCKFADKFSSQNELYCHFKLRHRELKEKICESCKYCNAPFPACE